MNKLLVFYIGLLLLFQAVLGTKAWAAFTMMEPGVPYLSNGNLAFGDYDNDGDLDLATIGSHRLNGVYSNQARLFRNDGNWLFTPMPFSFGDFVDGGIAWGDYDKDGWLDLVINGAPHIAIINGDMKLFHNDQGMGFTEVSYPFYDFNASLLTWADLDNDFDLDIICTGQNHSLHMDADLCLYYNQGGGEFTYNTFITLGNFLRLPSLHISTVDYNRDGYHDLCLSGASNSSGIGGNCTVLWRRNPEGGYTSVFGNNNPGGGGIVWFDYDNDSDLDLLYNGSEYGVGDIMILKRNDGDHFTQIAHNFPAVYMGAMCAGDYDNDGDDDLFISGGYSTHCEAAVFRHDENDVFTAEDFGLYPLGESYAYWADLDNDGDLDLAYTGRGMDYDTMFYRNECSIPNTAPNPPQLSYSPESGFSFSGASDLETPSLSLTYDLRIGTSPGAADIYCPPADLNTGYRKIGGSGRPSYSAYRLASGQIYYAAAQSIDGAFMGSAWSPELVIDLSVPVHDELQVPIVQLYPNPCKETLFIKANEKASFSAEVFNLRGQKVSSLKDTIQEGGEKVMKWNGCNEQGSRVANGVYFMRIISGSELQIHRFLYLR